MKTFIASSKELLAQLSVAMAQINVAFKALNNAQNALAKLAREDFARPRRFVRGWESAWRVYEYDAAAEEANNIPGRTRMRPSAEDLRALGDGRLERGDTVHGETGGGRRATGARCKNSGVHE